MKLLLFRVALSAASLIVALAAAELVIPLLIPEEYGLNQSRLFLHDGQVFPWAPPLDLLEPVTVGEVAPDHPDAGQIIYFQYPPDFSYSHQYPSNPRGYFDANNQVHYRTNSRGLRAPMVPREKSFLEKAPRRIVVLGDSFTWGEGVFYPDIYVSRLQRAAVRKSPRPRARFFNFSQPGLDTAQEFVLWLKYKKTADPELVILGFVPNDVTGTPAQAKEKQELDRAYTDLFQPPQGLARYSRLYRIGERRLRRRWLDGALVEVRAKKLHVAGEEGLSPWEMCEIQLRQLTKDVRAGGAEFMIVLLPAIAELGGEYHYQPIQDAVLAFGEKEGIHVIDLLPAFEGLGPEQLRVHPVDNHPNERAHRIIADAILADPVYQSFLEPEAGAPSAGGETHVK